MSRLQQALTLHRAHALAGSALALLFLATAIAEPAWIWSRPRNQAEANEEVLFRKSVILESEIKAATLWASCDNAMSVWINGREVAKSDAWQTPVKLGVKGPCEKAAT